MHNSTPHMNTWDRCLGSHFGSRVIPPASDQGNKEEQATRKEWSGIKLLPLSHTSPCAWAASFPSKPLPIGGENKSPWQKQSQSWRRSHPPRARPFLLLLLFSTRRGSQPSSHTLTALPHTGPSTLLSRGQGLQLGLQNVDMRSNVFSSD